MSEVIKGGCLCGQVRYKVSGPFTQFHLCHCSRCRKSTGSAHASNIFGHVDSLQWTEGKELVKRFDLADAKRFSRCFCCQCGSPLPHQSRGTDLLIIPAGSLDEDPDIQPQDHIFWSDKAEWYESCEEAPRFDRYPER